MNATCMPGIRPYAPNPNRLRHLDGTSVRYHGSIPELHGVYRVRRCRCACCWAECHHIGCVNELGPRYELFDPRNPARGEVFHVRHKSITRLPHYLRPITWGPYWY
ncbi:hypothetical protein OG216_47560 (plasmid) [Streptomycetaceae bacterium NBC_01309]